MLAATAAHAGTILETQSRGLTPESQNQTTATTTYAQGGSMRVESQSGESTSVVIFKGQAISIVNTREKTYAVMDHESMKRMADEVNPKLKQMQEQLAQMPPEQRAQMEKMMGSRMPGLGPQKTQEFKKTSRTDKIAGYPCSYVEILEDGVLSDELCVATPATIKGTGELMDAAAKMGALLRDMMSTLEAPWLKQMMERQVANFDKLGGVPVLTRHYLDGKPVYETTIKAVRVETIPGASFEVPAGYTKKDLTARH
jgi:hypothetical protein